MALAELMRDTISVFDKAGNLVKENEKASVQGGNTIITLNGNYPVEIGYFVERKTAGGVTEKYKVLEPNFNPGLRVIKAHYQMKVINVNAIPDPRTSSISNTIHASGNARVYQHSVDNSVNTYTTNDFKQALNQIKSDILDLDLDNVEQALTTKVINKISEEVESGNLNKDKVSAYISLFPAAVTVLDSVVKLATMAGL